VLVLDEPTNDLDVETLELLEALLQDYAGTLFLVSHDRAFLDNVVTQVIAFEGAGKLREYVGGYSDWQRQRETAADVPAKRTPQARESAARPARESKKAAKLGYREARELDELPGRIAALEKEQADITAALGDPALYREEPDRVRALQERYSAIENELMQCLTRWEELEGIRNASAARE
jgi:ATP-binding cassette subfamily F protein uup